MDQDKRYEPIRYRAEPSRVENNWRVLDDMGNLVGYRLSREDAEALAAKMNEVAK